MSKLGQYIHYSWVGYEKYGNFKNQSEWHVNKSRPKNIQPSDFNKNIFKEHKRSILAEAKGLLRQPNLKQLEKQYNTLMDTRYATLQELQSSNLVKYNSIIEALVKKLSKRIANTPTLVQEIMAGLKFENGSVIYRPTGNLRARLGGGSTDNVESQVPTLRWQTKRYVKGVGGIEITKRDLAKLIGYIDELKKYIGKDNTHADIVSLNDIQTRLLNEQEVLNQAEKIKKGTDNTVSIEGIVFISHSLAETYRKEIESIRFKYTDAEEITKELQAIFAEYIGALSAESLTEISEQEVEKVVLNAIQEIGTTQARQISDAASTVNLFKPALRAQYIKERKNSKMTQSVFRQPSGVKKIGDKEIVSYNYSFGDLGSSRQGKRDLTLTLEGQVLNVSMKNTNLSSEYEKTIKDELILPEIKLQNSSLLLYLLGAQSYYGDNIGNHYLNIFSHHENEPALATQMRKEAESSLSLYILYSAMTGSGQLRAGQEANILAIYDKAPNTTVRVKLFDMYDIYSILINKLEHMQTRF